MNLTNALGVVAEIDLSPILWKLKHPTHGEPMSDQQLQQAEQLYREWLALNLVYPEKAIVPSEMVDRIWHAHILDTQKYAADCDQLFGQMLHHYPYSDWRDAEQHIADWQETINLFRQHFGTDLVGEALCERGYCDPDIHIARPSYAIA